MTMFKVTLAALLASAAATAALAEVVDTATPAYVARVDSSVHFPSLSSSWAKGGRFVSPSNVRMIAPGASRDAVYHLIGEPMFSEFFPSQSSWNYIFNFYTGHGNEFVQCQYQVQWSEGRVTGAYWKDSSCLQYVADQPPPPPPPTAPPPPPPPPAPREVQNFVIYFPFDRADLTPEALAVVHAAADYAKGGKGSHVAIVGYTDSSGSVRYDEDLSERRAKATADALAGSGLDAAGLNVSWKGKTDLAVPTPDGTKEPLNRRATVMVTPVE